MHKPFRPAAKVDIEHLLEQASALSQFITGPYYAAAAAGWVFEVNYEVAEQLAEAPETRWLRHLRPGESDILYVPVIGSSTIPEGEIHLSFRAAKTFRTEQ